MHYKVRQTQIEKLKHQRRYALMLISALFVLCFLESLTLYQVIDKRAVHFTPLPPVVSAPFSVSRQRLSNSYLADMTRYFVLLRLNYTPATIANQALVLLRYTDGAFYGTFKEMLSHEIKKAKAHDIALSFAPVDTWVDEKTLTVRIDGDLTAYVGKAKVRTKRVAYRVSYTYRNAQLRVVSMTEITKEDNHA